MPQCASHSPHAGSNLDLHNVDDDENNHGLGTAASATRKRHRRESEGETPVNWTDTIVPNRYPSLEGHFVLEEFVSEAEEAALLEVRIKPPEAQLLPVRKSCFSRGTNHQLPQGRSTYLLTNTGHAQALDGDTANPWRHDTFNGHSEGKKYGVLCDLYRRVVLPPVHAMPPWLEFVTARMRATKPPPWLMPHHAWPLKKFAPNECNAIDYRRATGCSLEPHCDDRHMSGDVICNLSLAGDATMTYEREKGSTHSVRVELPRRSLQVQANGVRYNYTHGIANDDLHSARRVSITFRETFATKETAEVQDVRASWKTKGARR